MVDSMKTSNISKISLFIICSIFIYSTINLINSNQMNNNFENISFIVKDRNSPFIGTLGGREYLFEYISEEKVQQVKEQILFKDEPKNWNILYDGYATGLALPSEKDLNSLIGKMWIKNLASEPQENPPGASYDLSSQIYFPKVGNQQGQGSCAAWAVTYYVYGYLEAKDNGWNAKAGAAEHLISPAWTYNKVATSNYGSWMTTNAQILVDWGCATLATMPYDDSDYYSWGNESAWREAPLHRALDYYLMDFDEVNPNSTIDMIKDFINNDTPLTFTLHAGEFTPGFADGNFIISSTEYDNPSYNHAQTIVGYNDTISDDGDIGAFKVVNSWGNGWGDNGYYWLTYECLKEIGYELGDYCLHLCVVTDRLDYQPSLIATWEFDPAPIRSNCIISLGVGSYENPLESKTPWYRSDYTYSFPTFMAADISEFNPYFELDNNVFFYLEVGASATSGKISSFLIERYIGGVLSKVSNESRDVPQSNPGYVINTFMNLDHDLKVILETPIRPEINNIYTINVTIINNGIYNETNVNFYLYLGGFIIESKNIAKLLVGENDSIDYVWQPLDYGRYNFSGYTPPLIEEEYTSDNIAQKVLFIPEVSLFNGLYIKHSCNLASIEAYSYISYNKSYNSYHDVYWELNISNSYSTGEWDVDDNTRIMENSSGSFYFGNGYHSPFWVFTEIELGDTLPFASRYNVDNNFKVVDKIVHNIPGSGFVEAWILKQSMHNGGIAYYEKSTGILLNGTFMNTLSSNDTFNFIDTNANFTYVYLPGQFHLYSNAGSPDKDGDFTLTWDSSENAVDYSVY